MGTDADHTSPLRSPRRRSPGAGHVPRCAGAAVLGDGGARIAYGLMPVGPTDLAQLMMIEYASSYGNDWFVVPLDPAGRVAHARSTRWW